MMQRIASILGALVMGAGLLASSAHAEDKAQINVSAGLFDVRSAASQEFEGRLEYRAGYGLFDTGGVFRGFKPLVGVMANTAGAVFGYAGLAAPFALDNDRWEIVPSAALGAYSKGDGIDLGGTFEFHLGLGVTYAITGDSRLGISAYHISNANTHRKNPGVNSVAVTWSFAFNGP